MLRSLAVLVLVCLLFTSTVAFLQPGAASRVIIVPDNYPSITAAVANAADGDVIYVRNGVYNDSALIINKAITICGENVRNTIVNLAPTIASCYSSYFNRTYFYPADAITIKTNNVKISGMTITSTGGISGNGDEIRFISNIITLGKTFSITGFKATIERNTLNGDDWRITGNNLALTENVINVNHHVGFQSNGSYCNIQGNSIDGDLIVWGSMNTITRNLYDLLFVFYGDSNIIQGNSGELSLGNSDRSCSNNIVCGNVIKGPSVLGIWIGHLCRNNVFYDNYIADEGYAPNGWDYNSGVILCNEYGGIGTNNTFYHNMFVNNSVNVKFYNNIRTGGNFWDNNIQGNYWSDYNGSDTNNDGVGDTPYVINSENRDNYPLIAPFGVHAISIVPQVYDPPIGESSLPRSLTITPTSTPTINPTLSVTNDNPIAQQPATNYGLVSLLKVPEFATTVIVLLASAIFLIAIAIVLKLKKLSSPYDFN
jgi:nitrous oxidase accessory protein